MGTHVQSTTIILSTNLVTDPISPNLEKGKKRGGGANLVKRIKLFFLFYILVLYHSQIIFSVPFGLISKSHHYFEGLIAESCQFHLFLIGCISGVK